MSLVLIVEDTAIIRQPIEAALRREGYETLCAENGLEALGKLTGAKPNLILLDLAMPVMDGIAFLEKLRQTPRLRDVPVVVLTAVADKGRVVQAAKLGISGYMLKAKFGLGALLDMVRQHAGGTAGEGAHPQPAGAQAAAGAAPRSGPVEEASRPAALGTGSDGPFTTRTVAGTPGMAVRPEAAQPPADETEALRSIKPIVTRSELTDKIDACEQLRAFSPTVTRLIKITNNPSCSMDLVVKAISQDHAIALKILKLANSVVYTRGEPVDSVQKAVLRIGLERIRQAVLNIGVVEGFAGPVGGRVNLARFWEHAIGCGIIAAELAHATDAADGESAFTMGLLHDVGRIVLVEQLGEQYERVLAAAAELGLPLEQVESRMLLINHAEVMDRVLHAWKFSRHLVNPIVFHHLSVGNIRKVAPRDVRAVSLLGLANRLAHALMLGGSGNEAVYPTEDLCRALGVGADVIDRIAASAPGQTEEMKLAMLSMGNGDAWTRVRDEYAVKIGAGGAFRPLYASAEPGLDAYRVFVEGLARCAGGAAGEGGDAAPTVGIVHLTSPKERVGVSVRYRELEEAAGVGRLPLLIISPAAKLALEDSVMAGRAHRLLPSPVGMGRLLGAIAWAVGGARDAQPARAAA